MKLIFSLMKEQLRDYLSHKSKTTWGYLMNKLGARPTRSKLYFNILEGFSDEYTLNEFLEIKNELSSIRRLRFNSVIPDELSNLLGNVEIFEPTKLDLYFNRFDDLTFKDVLKILKQLKVIEVIGYFDSFLGNAINRTYAAIGNEKFSREIKRDLVLIFIKLTLYEQINTFFELEQDFSACSNLVEFNQKAGDDIYKMEKLDKDTLSKELAYIKQLFVKVKDAFKIQSIKHLIECIEKNKSNEKNMCTILATLETLQMDNDEMKKEIENEIRKLKEK